MSVLDMNDCEIIGPTLYAIKDQVEIYTCRFRNDPNYKVMKKVYIPNYSRDKMKYVREIITMYHLTHPSITSYFGYFEGTPINDTGTFTIIIEYFSRGDL